MNVRVPALAPPGAHGMQYVAYRHDTPHGMPTVSFDTTHDGHPVSFDTTHGGHRPASLGGGNALTILDPNYRGHGLVEAFTTTPKR